MKPWQPAKARCQTNVPGNPAYHFAIQPPGREGHAGWIHRPWLVPDAGVAGHPQHELAKRQQRGFGAMLSFELKEDGTSDRTACCGASAGSPWPIA